MKRFLSILLATIMAFSVLSLAAFASDETDEAADTVELRILEEGPREAKYRDRVPIQATAYGLTDDQRIEVCIYDSEDWLIDENDGEYGWFCVSFDSDELEESEYTVRAFVYDRYEDSYIAQETQTINVRTGFFAKLRAFIMIDLFGRCNYAEDNIPEENFIFADHCRAYYNENHPWDDDSYVSDLDFSVVPETTEEIVTYYNEARKVSLYYAPDGHRSMSLVGNITGDDATSLVTVLTPVAARALENNSKDVNYIPGASHPDIKVSDVREATATTDSNGNVVISIALKGQTDGPHADSSNGGPVARGIETLGDVDYALDEIGAEFTEGEDTLRLEYTDANISNVVINPENGHISSGVYHYLVNVSVGDARAKLGVPFTIKNFKATIDYTVELG